MRIAAIQHDIVWEDPSANHRALAPRIAAAADAGAGLVVLAEMYATGFSMAPERVAEQADGPSTAFLHDQARTHGVWLGASVPTRMPRGGRPRNRFVLASPDGTRHVADKLHPFRYAGEHEHYDAGDAAITVAVGDLRVTPLVCYDLRFADVFWEQAPQTDVYLVVANWPAERRRHWQVLLAARAIENQAWVVGVNRVGLGDGIAYAGDSRIIDPSGDIVAAADEGVEDLLVVEVDPSRVAEVRTRFPFLEDRRPRSG